VAIAQHLEHAPPQPRQLAGEIKHVVELRAVTQLAPARVVQVLLAPGVVVARRLRLPHRVGADPHVLPRGRDRELLEAQQLVGVGGRLAVGVEVGEAAPAAHAAPSRA
jgi:hypothetical protein